MLNFLARTTAQLLSRTGNPVDQQTKKKHAHDPFSLTKKPIACVTSPKSAAHTVTAATITPQRRQTSAFAQAMSDALQQANAPKDAATLAAAAAEKQKRTGYKPRYDGRAKKRNWVDYGKQGADGNRRTAATAAEEGAATAEKRANFNPADRIKRKKCAILLGYSGVNYFGMQRNPEMKTIEEDLLAAMLSTGWITEDAFKQAQSIQFQRAARTDKGVSAARQCVSLKLRE